MLQGSDGATRSHFSPLPPAGGDTVLVLNAAGKVCFANEAAARLWNCGGDALLTRDFEALVDIFRDGADDAEAGFGERIAGFLGATSSVGIALACGTIGAASLSLSAFDIDGRSVYLAVLRGSPEEAGEGADLAPYSLPIEKTDRAIMVLDRDGRILRINRAFTALLGYAASEACGRIARDFLASPRGEADSLARLREDAWLPGGSHAELLAADREGNDLWLAATVTPFSGIGIVGTKLLVVLADISESKKLQNLQRDVLEALASGLPLPAIADLLCRQVEIIAPDVIASILLVDSERKLRSLAGHSLPEHYRDALEGLPIGPTVGSCGAAAYLGEPVHVADIATDPLWIPYRHLALPLRLLACWSSPIKRRDGVVVGTFAFYYRQIRDPSAFHEKIVEVCLHLCMLAIERHESRNQIARLSHFDSLTGLPNRARLHRHIDELLAAPDDGEVAFLLLGLDLFKDVNDTLGHEAGDAVLIEIANRLEDVSGPRGFLARSGGDTFVLVLPGCDAARAAWMADRMLQAVRRPCEIGGVRLALNASIGISLYPQNGSTREDLIKHADTAMYRAKSGGRGCSLFFSPEMNRIAQDRIHLGAALRKAIARGELRLHYQPQFRPGTGELYGVEALARWDDPEFGAVPPTKFIALAEEIGEIEAIGAWSLREACRQMREWRAAGLLVPAVSVNLSPLQFRDRELPDFVAALLREHGLPPSCLTLEITENIAMDQRPETKRTVAAVRALGVGLAMDDFGTGFSCLSQLAQLPITELKIDRSFMPGLGTDATARAIALAVIRIGQSLGLTVVAEGVETERQRSLLVELGCDVAQGYLFSRPVCAGQFEEQVRRRAGGPRSTALSA